MALVANHFRRQILRRAAEGISDASAVTVWTDLAAFARVAAWWGGRKRFCESEVDEFKVAVGVEEDVLGFQVSVGDVGDVVEVGEDENDLGGVELDGFKGEPACTAEVGEYFAPGSVLELEPVQSAVNRRAACSGKWTAGRKSAVPACKDLSHRRNW